MISGSDGFRDAGDKPEEYELNADAEEALVEDSAQDSDEHEPENEIYETEQLPLADEGERLPWLDSDNDDDDADGTDGGRIFGFVLMGLIALAAIVGGIWWGTHRATDETLVADGSTIAAPAEPYKEAPKNPGGKTFDGTGDTAFAVSEGQNRPAKLGDAVGTTVPKPSVDLGKKPDAAAVAGPAAPSASAAGARTAAASPTPAAAAPVAHGPVVQVGAYSTRASAEAAWSRLVTSHSALSGHRHQIVEGKADIGTVYRLQAIPGDAGGAQVLCGKLKSAGLACQVKD